VGLVSKEDYDKVLEKERLIKKEIDRLETVIVGAATSTGEFLQKLGSEPLKTGCKLTDLICRPELTYDLIAPLDPERPELPQGVREQVNIQVKYAGYIARQNKQVEQFAKMEGKKIPVNLDYDQVDSLRLEARQKLKEFRPISIGQASRISGVTPADISMLLVHLEKISRKEELG